MNIIGDVAGRFNELMELLKIMPNDDIVFVGDLHDRGPQSMQVITFAKEHGLETVHSNHGDMFIDYYWQLRVYSPFDFLMNGGTTTLESYGVNIEDGAEFLDVLKETHAKVPIDHIEWLNKRPMKFKKDNVIVTHAPWTEVGGDSYKIWNREEPTEIKGKLQIFGHNAHWGVRKFGDEKKPWAICIDDSGNRKLTGYNTKTGEIYQVDYED